MFFNVLYTLEIDLFSILLIDEISRTNSASVKVPFSTFFALNFSVDTIVVKLASLNSDITHPSNLIECKKDTFSARFFARFFAANLLATIFSCTSFAIYALMASFFVFSNKSFCALFARLAAILVCANTSFLLLTVVNVLIINNLTLILVLWHNCRI